jgi:nitrate/nitrite-specific signal transduction histidine kinase
MKEVGQDSIDLLDRGRSDCGEAQAHPAEALREALRSGHSRAALPDFLRLLGVALEEASTHASGVDQRLSELERRLSEVQADGQCLTERLVAAEQQSSKLMNLYVATYQLHASLDPEEVRSTIAEIAANLLGAESFALLLRSNASTCYDAVIREGDARLHAELFPDGRYLGKDSMIDAALADGYLHVGPRAGSRALAVVPLSFQGDTVGALVILRLLAHKRELGSQDTELLELMAVHAASALFVAQVHAAKERKLKTLESLVKLARKD